MASSLSVSLDTDYEMLLPSKFQLQSPQSVFPIHAETAIAIVCSDDHALMQYAALSIGP